MEAFQSDGLQLRVGPKTWVSSMMSVCSLSTSDNAIALLLVPRSMPRLNRWSMEIRAHSCQNGEPGRIWPRGGFDGGIPFSWSYGLTPKDHSTGGKVRLGVITRAGDEASRDAQALQTGHDLQGGFREE